MHIRFLNIFPIYIFYYKEFICKIRCHKNIAFMLIFIITNCVLMLLYRRKIEKKSDRFNIKNILSLFYYRYFIYIYIYILIIYLKEYIHTIYITYYFKIVQARTARKTNGKFHAAVVSSVRLHMSRVKW